MVNPAQRFNVATILDRLAAIAETMNWSLKGPLDLAGKPIIATTPEHSYVPTNPPSAAMPTNTRTTAGNSTFYDDRSLPAISRNSKTSRKFNRLNV